MKKTIGIFSGSKTPLNYDNIKAELQYLAKRININKFNIVYGGGNSGLMGIIPTHFNKCGGEVTGFNIQTFVDMDILNGTHINIGKQVICDNFDIRQNSIINNSDIILVLPGGLGTIYEFYQVLVYNDLNLWKDKKQRKIILFNFENYYDELKVFINKSINNKLTKVSTLESLYFCDTSDSILSILS